MATIHGLSHRAIVHFRDEPAALSVYWIYLSRANKDNVAWPSLRGLKNGTGWSINVVSKAREWLIAHKALEEVKGYTPPEWLKLPKNELTQKQNLDRSEYYRPTGVLEVDGKTYPLLYFPGNEAAEEIDADVTPDATTKGVHVSPRATSSAVEHAPDETELNSSIQLDSSKSQLGTKQSVAPTDAALASKPTPKKRQSKKAPTALHADLVAPVKTAIVDAFVKYGVWDKASVGHSEWGMAHKAANKLCDRETPVQPEEIDSLVAFSKQHTSAKSWATFKPMFLGDNVASWRRIYPARPTTVTEVDKAIYSSTPNVPRLSAKPTSTQSTASIVPNFPSKRKELVS